MIAITNANLVLETGILWEASMLIEADQILAYGVDLEIPADAQVVDADGAFVGPGFVDIHVHGGGGYQMHLQPLECAEFFLQHGTTTILPTPAYDLPYDVFLEAIKRGKAAMKAGGAGRAIAGFYMEGPYMNPEYGAGAFRNPWRHPLNPKEYESLVDEAGEYAKVWAIAPEREGLRPFLEYARKVNPDVLFAIGHSEALPEQIQALGKFRPALQTHCTNATGRVNDAGGIRGTGPDEYCLEDPGVYTEMISDSCATHVRAQMQRMILRIKGVDKVILITDSTMDDGECPPQYAHVPDINFDEQGGVSGSKLTLDQACRNVMMHTTCGMTQAFLMASRNPARVLGMEDEIGSIAPGKKANLVFVDAGFRVKKVMLLGEFVK